MRLYYNESSDQTTAIARFDVNQFSIGNPKVRLSNSSSITINNNSMDWDEQNHQYELVIPEKVSIGTFVYVNDNNETYTGTVTINDITGQFPLDTITKDSAYTINWTGNSLDLNELAMITIEPENNPDSSIIVGSSNSLSTTNRIVLQQSSLARVLPGKASIWITRRQEGEGDLASYYNGTKKTIFIKE